MKLSNIGTVLVHGRNELHLKFNTKNDLILAYAEITQRMERELSTSVSHKIGRKWINVKLPVASE